MDPTPATKPGAYSSEFWLACGAQITAFIVALNTDSSAAIYSSGAVALASIVVYLLTRFWHKANVLAATQAVPPVTTIVTAPAPGVRFGMIALLLLGLASPAFAQTPYYVTDAQEKAQLATWRGDISNRLRAIEQQGKQQPQQPGTDPALLALLNQIQSQNQASQAQMMQLMQLLAQKSAPAPIAQGAPIQYHIYQPAPGVPLAPPQGGIPLTPNPQVIPLQPSPQVIPLVPNPQAIPLAPNPIQIHLYPAPPQIQLQPLPGTIPLAPLQPSPKMPPAIGSGNPGPPQGYQRLTTGGLVLRDPYSSPVITATIQRGR